MDFQNYYWQIRSENTDPYYYLAITKLSITLERIM